MQESDLAKANRQMIAERTALLEENRQLKTAAAQRAVNSVAEWAAGVEQLTAQAERGDFMAKEALKRLARLNKAILDVGSGLEVVRRQ